MVASRPRRTWRRISRRRAPCRPVTSTLQVALAEHRVAPGQGQQPAEARARGEELRQDGEVEHQHLGVGDVGDESLPPADQAPWPSTAVHLVHRLVLAAKGRTDGLRAQVRQVADAGPTLIASNRRLTLTMSALTPNAAAVPCTRLELLTPSAVHLPGDARRPACSPVTTAKSGPGIRTRTDGERQELCVLRPRHESHATRGRIFTTTALSRHANVRVRP